MATTSKVTFQEALDAVEALTDDEQEELIGIVERRRDERRRQEIVQSIKEGREAYARGETHSGSIKDLMKEVDG